MRAPRLHHAGFPALAGSSPCAAPAARGSAPAPSRLPLAPAAGSPDPAGIVGGEAGGAERGWTVPVALALTAALSLAPATAMSDPARIVAAEASASERGWTVSVTLRHGDTGWDDYADGWRVVTADGTILATRTLAHPHVAEQPFTRSLSGLDLPSGTPLYIESSTNVTGWSGARHPLSLPTD